jgi:pyruvate/2-oxoglutarate dehydrogenase complex dihydrolipoamide acyltransferase (E2) component
MAKLQAPVGGSGIQIADLAPEGQHVSVCLRIIDLFDVDRPAFQNPQQIEKRDVTRFIFGLATPDGRFYLTQTFEFTISGASGANLTKFLKAWLGYDPQMGWDYCELEGCGALITVQHVASRRNPGVTYASIAGIAPVHPQLANLIPSPDSFVELLAEAEQNRGPAAAPEVRPAVESSPPAAAAPAGPPRAPARAAPAAPAAGRAAAPRPGALPPRPAAPAGRQPPPRPGAPAPAAGRLPPRAGAPAPGASTYPPAEAATGALSPVEEDVPF